MLTKTKKRTPPNRALLTRDNTIRGAVRNGVDGAIVEIQARAVKILKEPIRWRKAVEVTGAAAQSVKDSIGRIEGAFAKLGIPEPMVSIVVNIAPAEVPKSGPSLDLPIALALLYAAGELPDLAPERREKFVFIGALDIHGQVRRIVGALPLSLAIAPGSTLICPDENQWECRLIKAQTTHATTTVCGVESLEQVIGFLKGSVTLDASKLDHKFESPIPKALDISAVRGHEQAKRAMAICAAGGHNLLMIGHPGEGKSMLASVMPGIMPRLAPAEIVELTKVYSAAGQLDRDGMAVTSRPFRSIHNTATIPALIGGSTPGPNGMLKPGEITLAHLGVLFADEIPQFPRPALEALRQPLESGEVHITRVVGRATLPARFTLVAAMNPCPCGYYGLDRCTCDEKAVKKYQNRLSGPIVDRIDLQVEMERLSTEERFAPESTEPESPKVRAKVEAARVRQQKRFEGKGIPFNAAIPGGSVRTLCQFSDAAMAHYQRIVSEASLSTRSTDRLAKVARTVADLADSDTIEPEHLDEAASFVVGGLLRSA